MWNLFHFSSTETFLFSLPNIFPLTPSSSPLGFQPKPCIFPLVCFSNLSFFMHFTYLDLGFGFSWNFWGFWKLWVLLIWCYMFMHCITFAFSQCFMHYRSVFICWNFCYSRIGLGWTHDAIFFARHMPMHCSCIHTFSFPYLVLSIDGAFLFVSLSLSRVRVRVLVHVNSLRMAPKHKPLHPGTLFVPGNHLLILLLFTSGSVMRRPIRTSWRISPNVAFIWNAALFY